MAYDFDRVIDRRGGDSYKWMAVEGTDAIPMPVADMDFAAPPCVLRALAGRLEHAVFGYAQPAASVSAAIVDWAAATYGWTIEPEWIVWLPGLETGLNVACRMLEQPSESVITLTPVYPPFLLAPPNVGRRLIRVPLAHSEAGYAVDAQALEAAVTDSTRLMLLCNPQNPSGRVLTRHELMGIADVCQRHDMVLVSDEIHSGLILDPGKTHIPTATLGADIAARTITLMSPSKTFNLAGLMCGFALISDSALRGRFQRAARGFVTELNAFGFVACEAAYREGEDWRRALVEYLRANRDLVAATVAATPGLRMDPLEATYLAWIDCRPSGIRNPFEHFRAAGLVLSDGRRFGSDGFIRLNFGCPRATLREGLSRLTAACRS